MEAPTGGSPPARGPSIEPLLTPLIVLDTDVVVTALLGKDRASSYGVLEAVRRGEVRLALSVPFLRELSEVVRRPSVRTGIPEPDRAFMMGLDIGVMGVLYRPARYDWPSVPDPKDYWQPDLAWESEADYIVAWDPHLLDANLPFPVEVVTPPQLLARLPTWSERRRRLHGQ